MTCKGSQVQVLYRPLLKAGQGPVSEAKELLKQLQSTDKNIHELQTQLEAIPKKVETLEKEIERLYKMIEDSKQSLVNAQKELKLSELNLKSQEEAVAKYNSQLFSARTNEEYKAFLKEIETAETRKKETEDQIIEWMEKIEEIDADIARRQSEIKTEEGTKRAEIEQEKARQADLEKQIKEEQEKRESLRGKTPAGMLSVYDRIGKSKGIIAAALVLDDNRCSGCLNPIPAQKAIEAEHSEEISFCEYCGRILLK